MWKPLGELEVQTPDPRPLLPRFLVREQGAQGARAEAAVGVPQLSVQGPRAETLSEPELPEPPIACRGFPQSTELFFEYLEYSHI